MLSEAHLEYGVMSGEGSGVVVCTAVLITSHQMHHAT